MLQFWDEVSGAVQLGDGARLYSHMPRQEVLAAQALLAPDAAALRGMQNESTLPFPAFSVAGGKLACLCQMHGDKLHAVEFTVVNVGAKRRGTADQQRALLFQCLRCADPSPDSKHGVLLKCAFGNALLVTDPRTGGAMLRLTYR